MSLQVSWWVWAATIGTLALILGAELAAGIRRGPRPVSLRAAAIHTGVLAALAVAFGLAIMWLGHPAAGSQFLAGWLTEYSLSLDNLFIFVLLIGGSTVPRELHNRVLLVGVALALVLRGIVIAVGASVIGRFGWVMYIFGALLIFAAARLIFGGEPDEGSASRGLALRLVRRVIPVSSHNDGGALITRSGGRRAATPLLFLMIAVAGTDLVFALDSIPAVFGLTHDAYLVFTTSAFALLGLRQLYVLIGGLLQRLVHLSAGLAAILLFIGFKLITEALASSGVRRVGPVPVPHISTGLSLAVIGGVLVTITLTSLVAVRRAARRAAAPPPAKPSSAPARSRPTAAPRRADQ